MQLILAAGLVANTVVGASVICASPLFIKIPHHTSALDGAAWVQELLEGHPGRIQTALGMRLHVFRELVTALRRSGVPPSKWISLEEQVAIFLHASVTGLSIRHLGEHFQHSNETISL